VGFFEVSRPVRRRMDLAAELPTDHPEVLDQIDGLIDQIPDPDGLHAETRAGSLSKLSRLRNRLDAVICELAASADEHADSRVLDAGTTGTLVAAATVANPQAGSATVARGNALQHLPAVRAGFARRQTRRAVSPSIAGPSGQDRLGISSHSSDLDPVAGTGHHIVQSQALRVLHENPGTRAATPARAARAAN